jgi:hypothetical protein
VDAVETPDLNNDENDSVQIAIDTASDGDTGEIQSRTSQIDIIINHHGHST